MIYLKEAENKQFTIESGNTSVVVNLTGSYNDSTHCVKVNGNGSKTTDVVDFGAKTVTITAVDTDGQGGKVHVIEKKQ